MTRTTAPSRGIGAKYQDSLISHGAKNSAVAEAYRMLRTSVVLELGDGIDDQKLGIVVVTSAGRAEGKTTTCANLALVFSQLGRRVALVDADLRLPSQHEVFGVSSLVSMDQTIQRALSDPDTISEDAVSITDFLDLYLPGEFRPDLPSEVIATHDFIKFLSILRDAYDIVIVDTAPVGLVTDAAIAAQKADGVIFVVDTTQTSRRSVKRAFAVLEKARVRIIGTVMNRVHPSKGDAKAGAGYYTG